MPGALGESLGEAVVEIRPELSRFFNELHSGVKDAAEKAVSSNTGALSTLSKVGEVALASVAAGFAIVATASVKAADTFEIAHAQLENAVKNTGGNFEELKGKVGDLSKQMETYGYTNAQTETSLTKLVQATHDPTKAINDLGVAANIAAGRHMDLGAASQLLSRVLQGNYGVLVRLGVASRDQVKDIHSQQEAIDLLNKTYGGSAAAAADTFAGKQAALRAKIEDLEKSIGLALIPVIETLISGLVDGVDFFEKNRVAAVALGIVLGGPLAAAILTFIAQEAKMLALKIIDFFANVAEYAAKAAFAIAGAADAIYAALGPVGIALIGITALAVALDRSSDSAKKAGQAYADDFITSLRGSSGETEVLKTKIVNLTAAQEELVRQKVGAIATDHEYNAGLRESAKALVESNPAYQKNAAEIKKLKDEVKKLETEHKALTDAQKGAVDAGAQLADENTKISVSAEDLAAKTGVTTDAINALAIKMKVDLTQATQGQIDSLTEAADRLGITSGKALELRDALKKYGDATEDASQKSKDFKTALDILIGGNIDAEKAVVDFQGKIDGLSQKLKDNKLSFDAATQAGRDNITAVEDSVTAIRNHIEALQNQGASASALEGAFQGDTDALRRQLEQAGLTKTQIDQLLTSYGLTQDQLNKLVTAYDQAASAVQKFNDLNSSYRVPTVTGGGGQAGGVKVAAAGALLDRPTFLYAGEAGPEIVLPLNNPARMSELFGEARRRGFLGGDTSGGAGGVAGGGDIHLHFHVPSGVDPAPYARAMEPALTAANRELLHMMRSGVGTR